MFQKQFSIINCFWNVQNIRKNVYDIIVSPIYHKIKATMDLLHAVSYGFAVSKDGGKCVNIRGYPGLI